MDHIAQQTFQQFNTFSYGVGYGFPGGFYGGCAGTVCYIASTILYIINNILVPLLFAVAFIVFLYGVAQSYIFSRGDPEAVGKGHKLILWGLIGFAVMISVWGLVNVVANTFNLGSYYSPNIPYSPGNTNFVPSDLGVPNQSGGSSQCSPEQRVYGGC
jgi:hypothetical protein